jgi:multicomponent Na+:H+ antiporter subunit B
MVPFIQIFALYVIMHGSSGPGGGFQGGVIFGAGIILYTMIYGHKEGKKRMSNKLLVFGGMFLQYGVVPLLPDNPAKVSALLIDVVEIGIGITVLAVMISLFFDISPPEQDEEELPASEEAGQ